MFSDSNKNMCHFERHLLDQEHPTSTQSLTLVATFGLTLVATFGRGKRCHDQTGAPLFFVGKRPPRNGPGN